MVEIIVCIKQVPNTDNVRFNWKTGSLIRQGVGSIINPDDLHALELALQLRDEYGGNITALSMGPPQAEQVLREAYSLGVDRCILISDKRFAGSDTLVTSKILSRAINAIGGFHFIITGFETLDGNTSQVSYQIAEFLDIPHLTQINDIQKQDDHLIVKRLYGHEYQNIKVSMPVIIAMKRGSNKVRHPRLVDIKHSFQMKIEQMDMSDIGGTEGEYGFQGSPTVTLEGEIFKHKRKQQEFMGSTEEKIDQLVLKLKKYGYI